MKTRKINIRRLLFSLEKKYSDNEGFSLLLPHMNALKSESRTIRYPEFYSLVSDTSYPASITDYGRIAEKVGCDRSYREIRCFNKYAAISALSSLDSSPADDNAFGEALTYLNALSTLESDKLYYAMSEAERRLEESPYFHGCDDKTKDACREKLLRYAKNHSVSESEAAEIYRTHDPFERKRSLPSALYFPILGGLSLLFSLFALWVTKNPALFFFVLLPVTEAAKQLTDFAFSFFVKTYPIPKKKLGAVPPEGKTLTVITALLSGKESDLELADKIRNCAFACRDENALFGLLCDLGEAREPSRPSDGETIDRLAKKIEEINERLGLGILLFTRGRRYSVTEEKYMGWERKRGALIELSRLLTGKESGITVSAGDAESLNGIRYVITLDTDTHLYTGAVRELVGAMLHPSNKPIIRNGRVVKGYGVLQPRTEASLLSADKTPFALLSAGHGGSDIYATASYETYQSVFGEGSFCGKGIFDLQLFSSLLDGTYPEGIVLSHDLLEGSRLRAGALTDVTLLDDLPKSPLSCFDRSHRWIRGDLQATPFAGKYHKNQRGELIFNPISKLSKFKIYDNVRRALVPVFAVCTLLLMLFRPLHLSPYTSLFALSYLFVPFFLSLIRTARSANDRFFSHILSDMTTAVLSLLYSLSSLLHTAQTNLSALLKSGYRMLFSGKKLLEWRTAADTDRDLKGLTLYLYRMLPSLLAGAALILFCPKHQGKLFGILFFLFPFAAYRIGKPFKRKKPLSDGEKRTLMRYSADTWRFFSRHVGKESNHLPPDNVQFSPEEKTAYRTSPTNIGLYLLSCEGARELGLITENEMLARVKNTLDTVEKLPTWQGHLYNWYDTKTLFILGSPYVSTVDSGNFITSLVALKGCLEKEDSPLRRELVSRLEAIISGADFSCLYDKKRKLLLIGLNPQSEKSENSPCYDFFTSEARTTSFFAIASHQVEREHYRYLKRYCVKRDGYSGLYSWSGTMFEYLMPSLLLPSPHGSISKEAEAFAVREQKKAGSMGIWGISEGGYYDFDRDLNYQYKAFGVPSLGMKEGLEEDRVYSPYSSFLALSVCPCAAISNLRKMENKGLYGVYGFYEAIDMTEGRVGRGYAVIKSHMSHHMGMSLTAAVNALKDGYFVRAFMSDPRCASGADILEERYPVGAVPIKKPKARIHAPSFRLPSFPSAGKIDKGDSNVRILSENGLQAIMYKDKLKLSALKADLSVDPFLFGELYRPRMLFEVDGKIYDLFEGRTEAGTGSITKRVDRGNFSAECVLSLMGPRQSFIISVSAIGSFKSVCPMLVLYPSLSEGIERLNHPAYCDLELTAEYKENERALLFIKKHKRVSDGFSVMAVSFECGGGESFLTDRDILGSGYTDKDIEELITKDLGNKTGVPIDPFCAVKKRSSAKGRYASNILISVGKSKRAALSNLISARNTIKKAKDNNGARVFEKHLKRTASERSSAIKDPAVFSIASRILTLITVGGKERLPHRIHRLSEFYRHGISADNPIMCLTLTDDIGSCPQVRSWIEIFISCHKYIALLGIKLDTVILFDSGGEYMNKQREAIISAAKRCAASFLIGGSIYLIDGLEDTDLFEGCAAVTARIGKAYTIDTFFSENLPSEQGHTNPIKRISEAPAASASDGVTVCGGVFGRYGFTVFKNEKPKSSPPYSYPYALNHFGTLLTDNSLGYTWIGNCHERRITPYSPDRLQGMNGEILIGKVLDTEYDLIACSHTVTFGRGGALYEGRIGGVSYTVTVGIDIYLPCKAVWVSYDTDAPISVEYRITPILSDIKRRNRPIKTVQEGSLTRFIPTVIGEHPDEGFLYRRDEGNGSCFLLGAFPLGAEKVLNTILKKYQGREAFDSCIKEYEKHLSSLLPKVKFDFPDRYLSALSDYYLPYQTLVCRFFARGGFYQSGGAYGFRDQLQDCLALMLSAPKQVRNHIIRCACHQYREGDVMHWWHGIRGVSRGVRTRYSDDLLFLPYVTAKYISFTDDSGILDIDLPYLISPPLEEHEADRYETAVKSKYRESLYGHCIRAIERSLSFGPHGLPYMGGGDWNDGMNAVGEGGGESVWLGFFLSRVLGLFAPICAGRGDHTAASRYREISRELIESCEKCYSDGRYLRAFYSDGTPLGGKDFIDIIPQAFSVFAGGDEMRSKSALKKTVSVLFDPKSATYGLLFPPFDRYSPELDCENCRETSDHDPGYIAAYPPGMRENGGQYTHAAVWGIMAMYGCGMGDTASRILSAINPARICSDKEDAERYLGEPYFLAGDVSRNESRMGRCGWSLYTGSSGWYFNAVFACLCGISISGDSFSIRPHLSKFLPYISLSFSYKDTFYEIIAEMGDKNAYLLDGKNVNNLFYFDKKSHLLKITVEISSDLG